VKERDAAAAAIHAEVFAGVVPPPMQTQIQRMGGMSSAVIGGFCEHSPVVHELVAKFADTTAKETAKEHGWQRSKRPQHTRERHRIRQRLATGAWRDFHEKKIARLPYVDPSTEYARTLRHLQASDARWRAEKNRAQSPVARPWDAGNGELSRGAQALWRRLPAPATWAAGERRGRPCVGA
jgi:hypothetical protein